MPLEKWQRLAQRVGRMGRDELLDRSRQAVVKRSDAALSRLGYDFAKNARSPRPPAPGKFFFDPESVDPILALLKQRLPGREEQIIREAEQICQHRFDLLGYVGLDYGSTARESIDWHCDVVHGKRAPKKSFHRIHYLDYAECGDSKITWELNRHQHLVTLAKAFRLTDDRRFVDEILAQWRHWQAENPYPVGINWASSLEVAFRSLSWLWTYSLLQGSLGADPLRDEWLSALALHGRHIERYLSTYFSPNTHLLGEGVGLFFLGVLCPELVASERWRSSGWEIVLRESERQIGGDGFHFEQSTYYHVYALDLFLHAAVLAAANNIPRPKSLDDRLEQMLTALCLLARSGPPPQFGDDDGGRLFDPRRNRVEHLIDPLATGAILFRRGDFKAVAGALREETLWLLGEKGARQWDQLEETPVTRESTSLPEAGYYLLTTDKTQLVVDAGPLGPQNAGHGHADALSICLQSQGRSLLIDCGTSEYVGPHNDRELFRETRMHNTLRVDGVGQAEPGKAFSWRTLTRSIVEQWVQGRNFDLLAMTHDGYRRLKQPVTHRRWVASLKNGAYLVRDLVEGTGTHRIDIAWHLGQDLEFVKQGVFRLRNSERGLAFLPAHGPGWSEEIRTEMWSPAYGKKAPMTVLNFGADAALPTEFAVLWLTLEEPPRGDNSFRRMTDEPSAVSGYEYSDEGGEYSFFFSDLGVWRLGSMSSDAKYVCHKRGPASSDEQLSFCNGSYAIVDGGVELRCRRQVGWAESMSNATGRMVYSSDPSAIVAVKRASVAASTIVGEI